MKTKEIKWHFFIVVVLVILYIPLFWMIATAFKTQEQIFANSINILPVPATLDNFRYVMKVVPFVRYIFNTFVIATAVTLGKLFTSFLAAYAFTQFHFKGRELLFYTILLTMFIPFSVTMMPNYLLMSKLGLLNTYSGVILPQLADAYGIFLMRQSIRSIPVSLFEAARLDKVGHWRIIRKIIFPIIKPTVVALSILFFINTWNEYFWPFLMINSKNMYTLPLALQVFTNVEGGTNWGAMMAAATLTSLLPLLVYFIAQRQIISTFITSGIKG